MSSFRIARSSRRSLVSPDAHTSGVVKSQTDPDLVYACRINDDGTYTPRTGGRQIRVYTELDLRLMFGDLFAKLETNYGRDASP